MEVKLDKKAAKKLAEEQLLLQLRKDALLRESALDQKSLEKLKGKWYDIFLDSRIPEMQDNLRHILHYMEKLIEADTFRKLLFEDEREELNERYLLQAQSHTSALDKLYDIYKKRIQDLHGAYNQTAQLKKLNAEEEFRKIEERENMTKESMETMLYQMQKNRDEKENTMNCNMFLKLDDERSKNTEKYENLRQKLEKKMEKRWGEISSTITVYNNNTQQRRKEYLVLKLKDDIDSKIIFQQMKKTQKLFEQLEELKKCYDLCYAPKETISLIIDLREEKAKFFDAFKQLKSILDEELKTDESHLKNLTVTSNGVTEELKKICSKGEQILTLYRICRKMETEQEKVIPVGGTLSTTKQAADNPESKKVLEEASTFIFEPGDWMISDFEILGKFWKKVGKVQLSKLALMRCVQNLEKENAALKKSLATYMRRVASKK